MTMSMSEIKGLILKSRYDFVEHVYQDKGVKRAISLMKGQAAELFTNPKRIRATAWYPLSLQMQMDNAICDGPGEGDEGIFFRMGAYSAQFWEAHTVIRDKGSIIRFMMRHGDMFPRFFRPGRIEVREISSHEVELVTYEFRSTRRNCQTNLGFYTKRLELCGVQGVASEERTCTEDGSDTCVYRIRWK